MALMKEGGNDLNKFKVMRKGPSGQRATCSGGTQRTHRATTRSSAASTGASSEQTTRQPVLLSLSQVRERRNQATKQAQREPGFKPTWSGAGSMSPTRGHMATTPQG